MSKIYDVKMAAADQQDIRFIRHKLTDIEFDLMVPRGQLGHWEPNFHDVAIKLATISAFIERITLRHEGTDFALGETSHAAGSPIQPNLVR